MSRRRLVSLDDAALRTAKGGNGLVKVGLRAVGWAAKKTFGAGWWTSRKTAGLGASIPAFVAGDEAVNRAADKIVGPVPTPAPAAP